MNTTIDAQEIAKFAVWGQTWWDLNGPFKTLHDINPLRLDLIQSYVSLSEQRVLDLGCGGGILCEGLAKASALVTGLDVEPLAIETAKKHAAEGTLSIDYRCEPIENFSADLYPIITCMEMLEHVEHPERVLQHATRLLSPGGYLFLSTINRTPRAYLEMIVAAEYILGLLPRQTHDFKKFIKPSELAHWARACDLTVLDVKGMRYTPYARMGALQSSVAVNYFMICQKQM